VIQFTGGFFIWNDGKVMTAPKIVDWERVEAEYRIGIKTLREIAEPYKITEAAIRKRAKRDKWSRDLTERIRLKADDKVRKALVVREPSSLLTQENEEDVVEFVANDNALIITKQFERVDDSLSIVDSMLFELRTQVENKEIFEKIGDILRSEDKNGNDKLNDIYQKVISFSGRTDSIKKLSETLKTLIELQRKIRKIDDEVNIDTNKRVNIKVNFIDA